MARPEWSAEHLYHYGGALSGIQYVFRPFHMEGKDHAEMDSNAVLAYS